MSEKFNVGSICTSSAQKYNDYDDKKTSTPNNELNCILLLDCKLRSPKYDINSMRHVEQEVRRVGKLVL
jgi:hypothetical protein